MGSLLPRISARADLWAEQYRFLKGRPYRFNGKSLHKQREFLRQPLADNSKLKTLQKSRQAGVSENSVTELLHKCTTYFHKKFMYLFPTKALMQDFAQTRINVAIETSPHVKGLLGNNKGSLHLKHIGTCDVFFRSGSKASSGEGSDIDGIFFDERDRMHSSILTAFKEGLSSSDLGFMRDISTPSLPGYGVNISFEHSDKKFWMVKCTACGHWQNVTFPDSLVKIKSENRYAYRCLKCKRPDVLDRTIGEWVPLVTDKKCEWSGYQISQLDCPWITPDEIVAKRDTYLAQLFYNYVLGRPYIGSNILISQDHINNGIVDIAEIARTGKIVMGADWGDVSYFVIGMIVDAHLLILHYESIRDSDPEAHIKRAQELMNSWQVDLAVYDTGYGKDRNATLFKSHPKIVYACNYVDTRQSTIIENKWAAKGSNMVTANRTISFKIMARAWLTKEILLPRAVAVNNSETLSFFAHLKSLAIKLVEEKEGEMFERIANLGPDHYAHAANYMMIAYYRIIKKGYATIDWLDNPIVDIHGNRLITKVKSNFGQ